MAINAAVRKADDTSLSTTLRVLKLLVHLIWNFTIGIFQDIARCFIAKNWRQKDVTGKLVVITGGCGALGFEMAKIFLAKKARVLLLDINTKALTEAKAKLHIEFGSGFIQTMACDVTDFDGMCRLAEKITGDPELGSPDILICGAAVLFCDYLVDATPQSIKKTFEINVFGVFWTVKAFLPTMAKENRGQIVLISSGGGLGGGPAGTSYCASKFAVTGFGESVLAELKEMGATEMTVSILHPFFFDSPLVGPCSIASNYIPILTLQGTANDCVKHILLETVFSSYPFYIMPAFAMKYFVPRKTYWKLIELAGVKLGVRGKQS